jgi:hypothetical protein
MEAVKQLAEAKPRAMVFDPEDLRLASVPVAVRDRRFKFNQSGKRKAVIVIRERGGNTLPAVFWSEKHALSFIQKAHCEGTVVNADESANWNELHAASK